jgi:hypothetical protein
MAQTTLAKLAADVTHLTADVEEMKAANIRRDDRRSAQHKETMEALEGIRIDMSGQQGFLRGAQFATKTLYVGLGAAVSAIVAWLAAGNPPFK